LELRGKITGNFLTVQYPAQKGFKKIRQKDTVAFLGDAMKMFHPCLFLKASLSSTPGKDRRRGK
jgi:hypothetical protein